MISSVSTDLAGHKLSRTDFDGIGWQIKRWLRHHDVQQSVQRNGQNPGEAWAFSHEKIGEVFYQRYVAKERAHYMTLLLVHCAEWATHASNYALKNYATLLLSEEREQELFGLASDQSFLKAQKDSLIDNPSAPLRTLGAALACAAAKDDAAMMARFVLAHAAMVEEISVETWVEAYKRRGPTAALELADSFGDQKRRVVWYLLIAAKLADESRNAEAEFVLERLNREAVPQLPSDLFFVAESIFQRLVSVIDANLLERVYAQAVPEAFFNSNLARYIKAPPTEPPVPVDDSSQAQAPGEGSGSNQVDDLDEAIQTAGSIRDPELRALALKKLVTALADAERFDEAEKLFDDAEQATRFIDNPMSRYHSRIYLVGALAHPELLDKALQYARSVKSTSSGRSTVVVKLIAALTDSHYFPEAERVAHSFKDPWFLSQALLDIAEGLSRDQISNDADRLLEEAIQAARRIGNEAGQRSQGLMNIAEGLVRIRKREKSQELFEEAVQSARAVEFLPTRYYCLRRIAQSLTNAGFLDEAKSAAPTVEDLDSISFSGDVTQSAIADLHGVDGSFKDLEYLTKSRERSVSKAQSLGVLAASLARVDRLSEAEELFTEAEKTARAISAYQSRSQTLLKLCESRVRARQIDKAKEVSQSIEDAVARSRALCIIASHW